MGRWKWHYLSLQGGIVEGVEQFVLESKMRH
jgi:hypothetical protein